MRFLKLSALMAVLLFNAVLLLSLVSLRTVPAAGQGGGTAGTKNGDVNCDGRINIADPVYLLQYLFNHGSDTCVLAQQGPGFQEVVDQLKSLEATVTTKWPPKAEDIVNFTDLVAVSGTSPKTIFSVPSDRRLVITEFAISSGNGLEFSDLVEVLDSKENVKLRMPWVAGKGVAFSSHAGLVFSPSSKVTIRRNPAAEGNAQGDVLLIGYLTN